MTNLAVGTKVICNGYDGAVREICTGQMYGMAIVHVPGGRTCVAITELAPWSKCDRLDRVIDQNWGAKCGWNRDCTPITR